MDKFEASKQRTRINAYEALEKRLIGLQESLGVVQHIGNHAPGDTDPFTGNFHDSRVINYLTINFSKTVSGRHAVAMELPDIELNAPAFRKMLVSLLQEQIAVVRKEMEAL